MLMTWSLCAQMVKQSFASPLATLDSDLIVQTAFVTSEEAVKQGCLKWIHEALHNVDPFWTIEATSAAADEKLRVIRDLLAPFRRACIAMDDAFANSTTTTTTTYSCEVQFLLRCEKRFLTSELIAVLVEWAQNDLQQAVAVNEHLTTVPLLLKELGWMHRLELVFLQVCYDAVLVYLKNMEDSTQAHVLESALTWCRDFPQRWFSRILPNSDSVNRIEFFLYQQFGLKRSQQLFDIIAMCPHSKWGILDLKQCLLRTHQTKQLVSQCTTQLEKRLLILGSSTNLILTFYVRLIKTMTLLDPTGMLLDQCSQGIKQYLRGRLETIKCIVQAITDSGEPSSEALMEELGDINDTSTHPRSNDEDDDAADESPLPAAADTRRRTLWDPLPTKPPMIHSTNKRKWEPALMDPVITLETEMPVQNILSDLIRVYGSDETFMAEYQTNLSERLLKTGWEKLEDEVERVEKLKKRFGEELLAHCSVMLHDANTSRRTNANIGHEFIESLSVSGLYWPALTATTNSNNNMEEFELHPRVRLEMMSYAADFTKFVSLRKLAVLHHLGSVDLELHFANGSSKEFSKLTTFQANLILFFQDMPEWTMDTLAEKMHVERDVIRKRAQFWIDRMVLCWNPDFDTLRIANEAPPVLGEDEEGDVDEEEEEEYGEEEIHNEEEGDEEELLMYITGMVGCEPMELRTIHANLRLTNPEQYGERSVEDLELMLETALQSGMMEFVQGKYQA